MCIKRHKKTTTNYNNKNVKIQMLYTRSGLAGTGGQGDFRIPHTLNQHIYKNCNFVNANACANCDVFMSGTALVNLIVGWFPGYQNIVNIKEEVEEALRNIGHSTPRHCAVFLATQFYLVFSIGTQLYQVLCHSFATCLVYSLIF